MLRVGGGVTTCVLQVNYEDPQETVDALIALRQARKVVQFPFDIAEGLED
ncbi:hypothetical protein H0V99_02000 [Candidatus Saccharibacteria bacterium]|nr:hypothetical protein [Candidatus Saccharibacteria bacterium]